MNPLHATLEEFEAEGFTLIECHCPRCRVTRLRPIKRLPGIWMVSVLALLCFCLLSWTAEAQQGVQLTFQTLDGDTQQVNSEEIWRIRATSTSDEPPGAVVIDYAFDRVYVKEKSRQRGGEGRRRTAFSEIYPANRRPSLHRCHQGDRRHPRHPAGAPPECPCDHRLARRPDPGSGNARSHQPSAGEIATISRARFTRSLIYVRRVAADAERGGPRPRVASNLSHHRPSIDCR